MNSTENNVREDSMNPVHITLASGCTLREAGDLHAMLRASEHDGDEIVIDGSQVERIDTSGLQLLIAFVKQQSLVGRSVHWAGTSDVLIRHSRRLGIDAILALPAHPVSEVEKS
jgi:anti-anti-sigma regulatory factor